ncbi:MAG: hypothetical protein QM820_50265 [Minicystis sp.]
MLGRLLIGIVKGLVVGGLLGFGLVKLGMAIPGAVIAYLAAAVTGVVIGLVAGKPIWAKDAKIEAGAKAVVGALLGVGLMAAARHWLLVPIPVAVPNLAPEGAKLGEFSMTSLAAIAALLGGFYDADNDSTDEEEAPAGAAQAKQQKSGNKRIAQAEADGEDDEELLSESEKKRSKK